MIMKLFKELAYRMQPTEQQLLDLLRKFAQGDGGRRTGELKRRGWIRWEVTDEGLTALGLGTKAMGIVKRAKRMIGYEPTPEHGPIRYRLRAGYNGGRHPEAPHPAAWSGPDDQGLAWSENGAWTCDCVGFALWCIGIDRFQPDFPKWGGWINTNSMLASATVNDEWFEIIDAPEEGCLVVFGGKPGHVGVVTHVPEEEWDWSTIRVTHCSSGNDGDGTGAIQETGAIGFGQRGAQFLRYVGPA